jgi:hypothetical protein
MTKIQLPFFNNQVFGIGFMLLDYRNPNFGFTTKTKACKGAGQE